MARPSCALCLVAGLVAAVVGCTTNNPQFCSNGACGDAAIDSPPVACDSPGQDLDDCEDDAPVCGPDNICIGCDDNTDCDGRPATPACLLSTGACEVCNEDGVQSDDCPSPNTAVCDATTHTCRVCQADSECTEGVCDGGRCVAETEVVYMAPSGIGNMCTKVAPCKELKVALEATSASRRFISMTPGNYVNLGFDIPSANQPFEVVIAGHGSSLTREGTGNAATMLRAEAGARLTVRDLTIDGTDSNGDGVVCTGSNSVLDLQRVTIQDAVGSGVDSDCRLLIADSRILNNGGAGVALSNMNAVLRMQRTRIVGSGGSGLLIIQAKSIVVANSLIAGSDAAQVVLTQISEVPNSYFGLNTVAGGLAEGVTCATGAQLPISNSIIHGHVGAATNCTTVTYTLGVATSVPVIAGDPMLNADFHLGAASAARNAGDPTAMLLPLDGVVRDRDLDGDMRPTGMLDLGADEIP